MADPLALADRLQDWQPYSPRGPMETDEEGWSRKPRTRYNHFTCTRCGRLAYWPKADVRGEDGTIEYDDPYVPPDRVCDDCWTPDFYWCR
jgi:hypothetical protein